jgi:hypothetical protein
MKKKKPSLLKIMMMNLIQIILQSQLLMLKTRERSGKEKNLLGE